MTCRFMPCLLCFPGVEGPADRDPVDGDQGAVQDHERQLVPLRGPQRSSQFGGAGRQQSDCFVHIPPGRGGADGEPGGQVRERLARAQVRQHQRSCWPGFSLRQHDLIARRWRRITPAA